MSKVLILGGTGLLGQTLCKTFGSKREHEIFATIRRKRREIADIPNYKNITIIENIDLSGKKAESKLAEVLIEHRPEIIINTIALLDPKKYSLLDLIYTNSLLPTQILNACRQHLKKFYIINLSTDGVFDGAKGYYTEDDSPDAEDFYGITKLAGEVINEHVLNVRTSMYGPDQFKSEGLFEFYRNADKEIHGYAQVYTSGLSTKHIAEIFLKIISLAERPSGIMHLHSDRVSKYELLCLFNEFSGMQKKIIPVNEPHKDLSLTSKFLPFNVESHKTMVEKMFH